MNVSKITNFDKSTTFFWTSSLKLTPFTNENSNLRFPRFVLVVPGFAILHDFNKEFRKKVKDEI